MTVPDLAKFLGFSEGHIRNMVNRGEIPYIKLSAKAVRFDREEILAWIERRNKQHGPDRSEDSTA